MSVEHNFGRVAEIERALESEDVCKAKDLLGGMSFDDISKTLFAVAAMNYRAKEMGQSLPFLGFSEHQGPNGSREVDVYNQAHPYENELSVRENPDTKAVSIIVGSGAKCGGVSIKRSSD